MTSGVAFASGTINLGSKEMFKIVKAQKEAADDNAQTQIINLMTRYYKAEYKFSLVKEKYGKRLDENLNTINMEELMNLTKWFAQKKENIPKERQ